MELHASDGSGPLRCSLCHADLQEPSVTCPSCGTVLHAECRRELTRCPTLGCESPVAVGDKVAHRPVSLLALLLVIVMPSIPFLVLWPPFAYYCTDHLVTGFHMMASLWPLEGILLLAGVIGPLVVLNHWRKNGSLSGLRMFVVFLLSFWSMGYCMWFEPTVEIGLRRWESDVLAPRAEALKRLTTETVADRAPSDVQGYVFPRSENVPEGVLLYTVVGGGPWPGWGIFIPCRWRCSSA